MTYAASQSSPALPRLPVSAALLGLALAALAPGLGAQGRTAQATAFRKDPGGATLATLPAGTSVSTGAVQGAWTAATLEGWVFSASLSAASRDGFDVVVSAANGENLRASPNGAIVARLENGLLLDRLSTQGGWTKVRRAGWVSTKALAAPRAAAGGAAAGRDTARTAAPPPASLGPPADSTDRVQALRATPMALEPDGGTLATLQPGATGQVIGRNGEWVQVQLQGWVRATDMSEPASAALPGVTVAQVRANPARYVGQLLDWRVQFISIQTADELRPEIPKGARYLLTRGPLPESGFVYVIVTPAQLPTFQAASPLEEFALRGRLRAASTKFLPTPVLELVEVLPSQGGNR